MLVALLSSTLLSCAPQSEPPAHAFTRALSLAAEAPEEAAAACQHVASLRGECLTAVAAARAPGEGIDAARWCEGIASDTWRRECAFEVVEEATTADPEARAALCAQTGPFAPRCRLHLWNELAQDLLATLDEASAVARFAPTIAWAEEEEDAAWAAFWEAALHPRSADTPTTYSLERCQALPASQQRDCVGGITTAFRRRVNLLGPPGPDHAACEASRSDTERLSSLDVHFVRAPELDRWARRTLRRLCRGR